MTSSIPGGGTNILYYVLDLSYSKRLKPLIGNAFDRWQKKKTDLTVANQSRNAPYLLTGSLVGGVLVSIRADHLAGAAGEEGGVAAVVLAAAALHAHAAALGAAAHSVGRELGGVHTRGVGLQQGSPLGNHTSLFRPRSSTTDFTE